MGTALLIDSCSDLPLNYVQENSDIIDTLGMPVNIDDQEYFDDFGKTLCLKEFYNKLRDGVMPSTSQINVYRFYEKFKEHYDKGNKIIYIGFTSGMSGTLNNAVLARETFLEEYQDADITVIDTVSASIGEGILVVHAVEMLRNGKSSEEVINWIEENKFNSNHWFAVDDLIFLRNGGRISTTTAAIGTLLNVKPILIVDREGKLKQYSNVRGRKKALKFLVNKLKQHTINPSETTVIIGHGDCVHDAEKVEKLIRAEFNVKKIIISQLSTTIASHVGPNMIALAFVGDTREDK